MKHPKEEMTFVMIKPDGVARQLIGEILARISRVGLKIIALQMFQPTKEMMDNHYPKDEAWLERIGTRTLGTYEKFGYDALADLGTTDKLAIGKMVRSWLIDFMVSAPLVKMVIQGPHAVSMVRKMVGKTLPSEAEMGTIRGDFSADSAIAANRDKRAIMNVIHASETPEEAEHEIALWFKPEDICKY